MINKNVEKAIINQIKLEEHSSRLYLAMASWCEAHGYPGAAFWLYKQTEEERFHQLKFVKYVNNRNGYALLLDLDIPDSVYKSLSDIFEKVLAHEEMITDSINQLYAVAMAEKDFTTANFLQWYITEQIEEEGNVHAILDKINLVSADKSGEYLIDKELDALAAAKIVPSIFTTPV
jgi:ferritin